MGTRLPVGYRQTKILDELLVQQEAAANMTPEAGTGVRVNGVNMSARLSTIAGLDAGERVSMYHNSVR